MPFPELPLPMVALAVGVPVVGVLGAGAVAAAGTPDFFPESLLPDLPLPELSFVSPLALPSPLSAVAPDEPSPLPDDPAPLPENPLLSSGDVLSSVPVSCAGLSLASGALSVTVGVGDPATLLFEARPDRGIPVSFGTSVGDDRDSRTPPDPAGCPVEPTEVPL